MTAAVTTAGLAFALAMDAFAVAMVAGMGPGPLSPRRVFRLSFHFGLFQFMMPAIGWFGATLAESAIREIDHWVASGLLIAIGGKMVWESWHRGDEKLASDPTRGVSLVTLSVATSIDALAVGLGLRVMDLGLWVPCTVIGVCAMAMTALGMTIGKAVGSRVGRAAEAIGGAVLVAIGARLLISHLQA